jgi:hypothetical protein
LKPVGREKKDLKMIRLKTALAASLLASAFIASPVLANEGGNGNGNGNGATSSHGNGAADSESGGNGAANSNSNSAAGFAPSRTGEVPGQVKGDDESARQYAPGQLKKDDIDEDTTASVGQPNLGSVLSSIRAGSSNLAGVDENVEVTVIDIDDLTRGRNRAAFDNALRDNDGEIGDLQTALLDMGLTNLSDADAEAAVAVQVEADGSLTVFVDR